MLIKGIFDPATRRPYLQGLLFIPDSNTSGAIDFIMDTGSDVTTLNPGDGKRLGIEYNRLKFTAPFLSVGSSHKAAEVRAFVAFATVENILALYSINLSITPNIPGTESLPSMLGTDVLHRWHIVWDSSLDILDCEIITYDAIMPEELS